MEKMTLTNTRALVTGATGFIGPYLVQRLLDAGAQVTCLTLNKAEQSKLPPDVSGLVADLRHTDAVRAAVQTIHPTVIFHLAAVGVTEFEIDPIAAIQVNVEGTVNLLTAVESSDCRRFLFVGTSHEYGNNPAPFHESQSPAPANVYAASKSAAWHFCQMYHRSRRWPVVGVRLFGVYGPGQRPPAFLPSLIQSALHGRDFPMTAGEQVRDLVYVQDAADGMIRAATTSGVEGQVFNLCSGKGISLAELASRVMGLMGNPIRIKLGTLPYRPGQMWNMVGDNTQARQALGWQPQVPLEEGLRRTIAWCTEVMGEALGPVSRIMPHE